MGTKEASRQQDRPRRRLPAGTALRFSGCLVRFLLSAALAGAEILEGQAPFALALVAVSGGGGEGAAALLGAALGYISFRGAVGGLRYLAASMMLYALSLAMGEYQVGKSRWFMPAAAVLISGTVGFVYQSAAGWNAQARVSFFLELLITAGAVYLFRQALEVWSVRRTQEKLTAQQAAGLFTLTAAVFLSLARVEVAGISLGRSGAFAAVILCAWKWGAGAGAAAGIAGGIAMDLAAGSEMQYILFYALPGLLAGLFPRQRRFWCAASFFLSAAAAAVWTAEPELLEPLLREMGAGTVLFLLIPGPLLDRICALTRQEGPEEEELQVRRFAARRLGETARAYRETIRQLEAAFPPKPPEREPSQIWERTAEKVCSRCRQQERCWKREYQATRSALTDAYPAMLERGSAVAADFPAWFGQRCGRFEAFLSAANGELSAQMQRRAFQNRVRESRNAVCAHYGELVRVLEQTSAELAAEPALDLRRQRLVKQKLTALGLSGKCAVFLDEYGHLQVEAECRGAERLTEPEQLRELSGLMNCPLEVRKITRGKVRLSQKEPFSLLAGAASADRAGSPVSGDTGAWFREDSGMVNFLLCDGMGSGTAARGDSAAAVSLLEQFLRAGTPPQEALRTVGDALALRGEGSGGFTTIDLARIDLFTGTCSVYKLGAAPSYVRRRGQVEKLEGETLPAGLASSVPDVFQVSLVPEDCLLLVSDGVTGNGGSGSSGGGGDRWLCSMLADFDGVSPRDLAAQLLTESGRRTGALDDRTILAVKLERRMDVQQNQDAPQAGAESGQRARQ